MEDIEMIFYSIKPHRIQKNKWDVELGDISRTFDNKKEAIKWIYTTIQRTLIHFEEHKDIL